MRTGEFSHDQTAAALITDEAPEHCICNARHRREYGCRADADAADGKWARQPRDRCLSREYLVVFNPFLSRNVLHLRSF